MERSTGLPTAAITLPPLAAPYERRMNLAEMVLSAVASLRENKLRSLLTMLGVVIGVAAVVSLLALGEGVRAQITGELSEHANTLIVHGRPEAERPRWLDNSSVVAIKGLKGLGITAIAESYVGNAELVVRGRAKGFNATVNGVTSAYAPVNGLNLAQGGFIDAGHVESLDRVVVLGEQLARSLFGGGTALGRTVRVNQMPFIVVGVLAAKGGGVGGSLDDQIYVPLSTAQRLLFDGRTPDGGDYLVHTIAVTVADPAQVTTVQGHLAAFFRAQHERPADGRDDDVKVFNQAEVLRTLTTITNTLTSFLAALGGISLLTGGICIMNIMLVSVTERTREIGLRKALGARPADILLQFIVEAVVVSLVGGLIGLAIGAAIAGLVAVGSELDPLLTPGAVLLALGFASAVGLFFGIYPAHKAAQLDPIVALRSE